MGAPIAVVGVRKYSDNDKNPAPGVARFPAPLGDQGIQRFVEPPSVLLQNDCFAHYRRSIYSLLCATVQIRCTIVASRHSNMPFLKTLDGQDEEGIRYRNAPVRQFSLPGGGCLTWQPEALRFFWKTRPRVVIALGSPYSATAWGLAVLGRILRIPVLFWGHGLLEPEKGPKWWVRRLFYRLAWGHLLYGEAAKSLLMEKGFSPQRLYVVYNSLNFDEQMAVTATLTPEGRAATRARFGIPTDARVVIFTGRLEPIKRLDLLIDALALLRARGRGVYAILVGEGSQRAALEGAVRDRGLEQAVRFVGAVYDEASLGRLYDAGDLAVVPSGAGLSVIHALTYGVPVLIHDRGREHFPEVEAVQSGVTGFLYRYGSTSDLANKIDQALFPAPARHEFAGACRAVVRERYNPHRQLETILRAIGSALDSYDPDRRR